MSHTPGPWYWYWRLDGLRADCGVYSEHQERLSASVCRAPQYENEAQWAANARLIAAAPDLLEVARCIENALIAGFKPAEILDENSPIRDGMRAAIAKATGQKEG